MVALDHKVFKPLNRADDTNQMVYRVGLAASIWVKQAVLEEESKYMIIDGCSGTRSPLKDFTTRAQTSNT